MILFQSPRGALNRYSEARKSTAVLEPARAVPLVCQNDKVESSRSAEKILGSEEKYRCPRTRHYNSLFLGYKDCYNYYDIDVDKILLFIKSDNEYIVRYIDVNKMMIVPLQLKIKSFYNESNTFANNNRTMFIYNDDK